MYARMHIYKNVCIYAYMYVGRHVYVDMYVHTYITYIHAKMCIYMYTGM